MSTRASVTRARVRVHLRFCHRCRGGMPLSSCSVPPKLTPDLDKGHCAAAISLIRPPRSATAGETWNRFADVVRANPPTRTSPIRNAWVLIPFGFELRMLMLHVKTLHRVVRGFMVAESRYDIATGARKLAHLSDAIATGSFPRALALTLTLPLTGGRRRGRSARRVMTPGECREQLQDLVQRMQALGRYL